MECIIISDIYVAGEVEEELSEKVLIIIIHGARQHQQQEEYYNRERLAYNDVDGMKVSSRYFGRGIHDSKLMCRVREENMYIILCYSTFPW